MREREDSLFSRGLNSEGYRDGTASAALHRVAEEEWRERMDRVRRGEVYYVHRKPCRPGSGEEEQTGRPAVVLSSDALSRSSGSVLVAYCTAEGGREEPTHVRIRTGRGRSTVECEHLGTVSKSRLGDRIGACTEEELGRIERAVSAALGLLPRS